MAEQKRIKVLASDVGGVIALFKHNAKPGSLKDFADWLSYLTKVPSDEWQKFLDYTPGTQEYDFIAGNIEPKEFYWELRKIANVWHQVAYRRPKGYEAPFPDFQLFRKAWCNIFAINIELLERLRGSSKTYKVVLASNLDKWHYRFLWDLCGLDFIDEGKSVISCRDHLVKPDKAFFELIVKRSGVSAEEIFFFDDTAENIKAASECGIRVHLFIDNQTLFDAFKENGIVYLINPEKGETR